MENTQKRKVELIVLAVVVVLAVAAAAYVYMGRSKIDRERVMIGELAALRAGATLYKAVNKTGIPSLDVLVTGTYEAGDGSKQSYVVGIGPDRVRGGQVLDPFGSPYIYDTRREWIHSGTRGYGNW